MKSHAKASDLSTKNPIRKWFLTILHITLVNLKLIMITANNFSSNLRIGLKNLDGICTMVVFELFQVILVFQNYQLEHSSRIMHQKDSKKASFKWINSFACAEQIAYSL